MERMQSQTGLQKESAMVESLVAQGATQASGQAGKSTAKTQQSNMAALHRHLMATWIQSCLVRKQLQFRNWQSLMLMRHFKNGCWS